MPVQIVLIRLASFFLAVVLVVIVDVPVVAEERFESTERRGLFYYAVPASTKTESNKKIACQPTKVAVALFVQV